MSFYDAERFSYRPQGAGYMPYGGQPAAGNQPMTGYIPGYGGAPAAAPQMAGTPATAQQMAGMAQVPMIPAGTPIAPSGTSAPGSFSAGNVEESYIENILRLNLGKTATIYMTFENNAEWNAKIFKGKLEAAGRDHIIISDPETGRRYLLLMVNLDYITFDEPLNYFYPPGVPLPR